MTISVSTGRVLFGVLALAGVAALVPSSAIAASRERVRFVGRPSATADTSVVLRLPLRDRAGLQRLLAMQNDPASPQYRHWLVPAQFRSAFGATPETLLATQRALRAHGLAVTRADAQLVFAHGPAAAVQRAFGTELALVREARGARPAIRAIAPLHPAADLAATGATVVGLTAAPRLSPHHEFAQPAPANRDSAVGLYWFDDLKQAYAYPAYQRANGSGVTIAVVNFSDFSDADTSLYLAHEGIAPGGLAPVPATHHLFFGSSENAFDPNDGSAVEANLDVQQAAGSAPGATVENLADTSYPFFSDAFAYAVDSNAVDIVSISYGGCELDGTAAYAGLPGTIPQSVYDALTSLEMQGNAQGITFIADSGDDAGTPCPPLAYLGPATGATYAPVPSISAIGDSPYATVVGGTNLQTTYKPPTLASKYVSETAYANQAVAPQDPTGVGNFLAPTYFGSGGGVSAIYPEPDYQKAAGLKYAGRAVPDIAMHMGGCPHSIPSICRGDESRDEVYVGGQLTGLIGTSASAPEFAGLLAVKESYLHTRLGNENYEIYALGRLNRLYPSLRQGIPGYDGVVTVARGQRGYNLITGNGTPIANAFVYDPFGAVAGLPQTATNP